MRFALGLVAAGAGHAAGAPPGPGGPDFRRMVRDAKDMVFPAVVYIKCVREAHESGRRSAEEVSGSGVIISPEGEVITNWHVVDKATSVRCLLSDGRAMDATVAGSDRSTDLALLRLAAGAHAGDLPCARFGDSEALEEGAFVMAMGAPWGLNRSVSIGIVSCARRYLPETSEYSLWLQTDAAINPGNSGGPLVSTDGRIVGLNTRGVAVGDGIGFAVPASTITALLPHLRSRGAVGWGWTGLRLQPLRDFDRDTYFGGTEGVIVAETDPESPARRAGLRPRDRIVEVNGVPVTALTAEDLPEVRRRIGLLPVEAVARFVVQRGDERLAIDLTPREKGRVEGAVLDCPRWDFTARVINQFDNDDLYFYRTEGVFVYGVRFPGNAAVAGLAQNDIVVKIDGREVRTLADVRAAHQRALANVADRHRVVVVVLRNGLMHQVVLDFSRDYARE